MIGDGGRTFAHLALTRPRGARQFTVDDVRPLDQLRPWLAHAFRRSSSSSAVSEDQDLANAAGTPVLSGQVILTSDAKVIHQSSSLKHLLIILAGDRVNLLRHAPARDRLPAPVLTLFKRITGAANGSLGEPPRMQLSTPFGIVTLDAKWLTPPRIQKAVSSR